MKKKFIKDNFKVGDHVVIIKSYLALGGYKVQHHRTAVVTSVVHFGNKVTLAIVMDDDGVSVGIPEKNVELIK